jgi:hypothetical protein
MSHVFSKFIVLFNLKIIDKFWYLIFVKKLKNILKIVTSPTKQPHLNYFENHHDFL